MRYLNCWGRGRISKFHTFLPYKTLFRRKRRYWCIDCGENISDKEYVKYLEEKEAWYRAVRENFKTGIQNDR